MSLRTDQTHKNSKSLSTLEKRADKYRMCRWQKDRVRP